MNENTNPSLEKTDYQAPKIETVITPAELEREVHYAGGTTKPS